MSVVFDPGVEQGSVQVVGRISFVNFPPYVEHADKPLKNMFYCLWRTGWQCESAEQRALCSCFFRLVGLGTILHLQARFCDEFMWKSTAATATTIVFICSRAVHDII